METDLFYFFMTKILLLGTHFYSTHFEIKGHTHNTSFLINIDIERKNRLLKVCYVLATSATFLAFFLAMAINSTNEANNAGGTCC